MIVLLLANKMPALIIIKKPAINKNVLTKLLKGISIGASKYVRA
jgi:hypothetical protein